MTRETIRNDEEKDAYSTLRRADDTLAAPLRNAGIEVSLIGDCMSPRNQIGAIHEGHAVGKAQGHLERRRWL
ncbi:hypothetical protein C6W92_15190 [Roseovarius sp. A46]|nr:hypothetical protein C6W92_15190 [Roseovarius sp. A46]